MNTHQLVTGCIVVIVLIGTGGLATAVPAAGTAVSNGSATFTLTDVSAPEGVTQGDAIRMSIAVENNGTDSGSTDVTVSIDVDQNGQFTPGEVRKKTSVNLDAGETTNLLAFVDTDSLSPGSYDVQVRTPDDTVLRTVNVSPQNPTPEFTVASLSGPTQVTAGDTFDVETTVENTGFRNGSGNVTVAIDVDRDGQFEQDEIRQEKRVNLTVGERTTLRFSGLDTTMGAGDYTLEVATPNASITQPIEVLQGGPAVFTVEEIGAPTEVTPGDTFDANATIENAGGQVGSVTIEVAIDADGNGKIWQGEIRRTKTIVLGPGERRTVEFPGLATANLSPDRYQLHVTTPDDAATTTIGVGVAANPASFEFVDTTVPATVPDGDSFAVDASVENTGGANGSTNVSVAIDADGNGQFEADEIRQSATVGLRSGERTTVGFSGLDTATLSPGSYAVQFRTDTDTATRRVKITTAGDQGPQTVVRYGSQTITTEPGDTTQVDVVVTNASGGVGTYDFTATVTNASTARVTDVTFAGSPSIADQRWGSNNASVQVVGIDSDTADSGAVTIATLTIEGVANGSTSLGLDVDSLADEGTDTYQLTDTPRSAIVVGGDDSTTPPAITYGSKRINASPGTTETVDVVIPNASGGVGTYDFTATVGDGSIARVTDIDAAGSPSITKQRWGSNNESVRVVGIDSDTADSGAVTIATLTIEGVTNGSTSLGLSVDSLADENGTPYSVGTPANATITVLKPQRPTLPEGQGAAEDVDDDQYLEDLNGDGTFDAVDVTFMLDLLLAPGGPPTELVNNAQYFDFNGDNSVDVTDVTALLDEFTGAD